MSSTECLPQEIKKSEVKLSNIHGFGHINSRVKPLKKQQPKQLNLKRSRQQQFFALYWIYSEAPARFRSNQRITFTVQSQQPREYNS